MKRFYCFLVMIFVVTGCSPEKEKPGIKTSKSEIACSIDEKDLIPEGIAYDPQTQSFFLGSIYKKKIITVEKSGKHFDFIQLGQDGLLRCLGLKIDTNRRRLWAVSSDSGISCVHIYNIDTGELLQKLSPSNDVRHSFNDLVLTKEGGAYITDWGGSSVYYVPPQLNDLELYLAPASQLTNPNGLSISPDGSMLYVASHLKGIYIIDIKNKSFAPIANWLHADTRGIDGMMFFRNSLVCIRSGDPDKRKHHITRYRLGGSRKTIISAEIIDHKNKLFDNPTTGVIVGNNLYCLAVTSLGVFGENKMGQRDLLKKPVVLKYKL